MDEGRPMTPHAQTILADPKRGDGHDAYGRPGDCWRTAIACLLDLDPLDVPHFGESDDWWDATLDWAEARGDSMVYLPLPIPGDWAGWWEHRASITEHVILGGPSPRGTFSHVVIGTPDLTMTHDPHPSGAGLADVVEVFVYLQGEVIR